MNIDNTLQAKVNDLTSGWYRIGIKINGTMFEYFNSTNNVVDYTDYNDGDDDGDGHEDNCVLTTLPIEVQTEIMNHIVETKDSIIQRMVREGGFNQLPINSGVGSYSLKIGDDIKFPSGLKAEVIKTKVKVRDEFGREYYLSDIEVG
jgi:hypothetical protein